MEAIEARGTQEVVNRNLAIEALKKELDIVEAKKTQFVGEVGGLSAARTDLENLRKEVEYQNQGVEGEKVVEQLAAKCALKAIETVDNLHKEVDAERESSTALKA